MRNLLDFRSFSALNEHESSEPSIMLFEGFNEVVEQLQNAITNKFVCTIYYKGERKGLVDDGYRYIEPYALGVNKQGNNVVRGWLIKGTSRRGRIDPSQVPGWRLFRVDRISIVTPTLQKFTVPKKGYNADDSGMTEVTFSAQF
jgi:predicted DNA-binding transcriptional regulator YafY